MAVKHRATMQNLYYIIASQSRDNYESFQNAIEKVSASTEKDDWMKGMEIADYENSKLKEAIIACVYCGMCLDAFIYDYGAKRLGKRFMKKYVDKLDLTAKWVLVPKLVTGGDFPRDSDAYEKLTKLVKDRNKLVHFKAFVVTNSRAPEGSKESRSEQWPNSFIHEAMYNGMSAVYRVLEELDKIDPSNSRHCASVTTIGECFA